MDQASASSAASCARNPVAPRTSSSCSRSADRSQTGVPLPARSGPQSEPHAEPSIRDPSPSSPPSANSRLRAISCRSFTPAKPDNPAASLRDYCSGAYSEDARQSLAVEVDPLVIGPIDAAAYILDAFGVEVTNCLIDTDLGVFELE